MLEEVEAAVERVQERLLAPLTPEQRTTLVQLLAQLVNLHDDIAPSPLRAAEQRYRAAKVGRIPCATPGWLSVGALPWTPGGAPRGRALSPPIRLRARWP